MKTRIISALILAALCLPPLLLGGIPLKIMLAVIVCLASYEIAHIKDGKVNCILMAIIITFIFAFNYILKGRLALIPLFLMALITLSIFKEDYRLSDAAISLVLGIIVAYGVYACEYLYRFHGLLMLYVCFASLLTDVGAYFVGMAIGRRKLAERISPKKTVEGAYGGIAFGFISSFLLARFSGFFGFDVWFIAFNCLFLPIVSEIGDLAFSLVKRYYNAKDFSNLIPGHGGVLDRIDSLLFCLLFFSCMIALFV